MLHPYRCSIKVGVLPQTVQIRTQGLLAKGSDLSFISTIRISISSKRIKMKSEVKKMNLNIGNIGVWGFRHYEFLKQNRPSTVGVMRINGTLENYLKDVDQEAAEMLESLIRQYAKAEGVTESLKSTDQLEWVHRMNNIRNRAEEVVLNEIIYR